MSDEIKLPDNILVQCPDRSFAHRRAKMCVICKHYKGILKATVGGELIKGNEANDFQIVCGRPITRKLVKIEVD